MEWATTMRGDGLNSTKAPSQEDGDWIPESTRLQPSLKFRFPTLRSDRNPVVFLDVAIPVADSTTGARRIPTEMNTSGFAPPTTSAMRISIEVFATENPSLARNFYELCIGSTTRVTNGTLAPAGYKGTAVFDANPGGSLSMGDVLGAGGQGVFTIYQRGNHFYAPPTFARHAAVDDVPADVATQVGLVCMIPVVVSSSSSSGSGLDETSNNKTAVGCCFQILLTPPPGADSAAQRQKFFQTQMIVGRVVGQTPTEFERSIGHLQHVSKLVFQEQRAAQRSSTAVTVLPQIVQCGEW